MTVKELANFCGKEERTIRRWMNKASDKMSSIREKMSEAEKTKKASDFTIDEVEEILNASSLSKDAVNVLMQNARQPKLENQVGNIANVVAEVVKQITPVILQSVQMAVNVAVDSKVNNQLLLENPNKEIVEYYTILGYNNIKKLGLDNSEIRSYSFKAKQLSKEMGKEIHNVPDSKWGKMNTYHVSVLEELFEI